MLKSGDESRSHEAASGTEDIGVKYSAQFWPKVLELLGRILFWESLIQFDKTFFSAHTRIVDFLFQTQRPQIGELDFLREAVHLLFFRTLS